jgi:16S rRNA processing protein RimM
MTNQDQVLVKMGEAFHPHGIKGEVELRLINLNFEESSLKEGIELQLKPLSEKSTLSQVGEWWRISKLRFGNKVICTLEGVKDRTHLESLLPFEFFMKRSDFPELEEGEFYLTDIIDFEVFTHEGNLVGRLEGFDDNGVQTLFNIRQTDGTVMTLPFVEVFFPEVNLEKKSITVNLPEYTE